MLPATNDPSTGQFLSIDPDLAQRTAPFTYAGDDPVNEYDPEDPCGQLTRAGRAFAKHSNVFSTVSGGPAALNEAAKPPLPRS